MIPVGMPDTVRLLTKGGALIAFEDNPTGSQIGSNILPNDLYARPVRTSRDLEGEGDVLEITSGTRRLFVGRGRFGMLMVPIQGWVSPAVPEEIGRVLEELERECGEALASWPEAAPVDGVKPYLQRVLRNITTIQWSDWALNFAVPSPVPSPVLGRVANRMKVKVCLVGEAGTDKTALIRRHVLPNFDDRYIQTLGTAVAKKGLRVASPHTSGELRVDMTVWDIMGQWGFRELLKEAYFYGARGILAVCDITRRKTLDDLDDWIDGVYSVTGKIPTVLLGNKTEFIEHAQISEEDLAQAARAYDCPYFFTSARTGLNVELAFATLAERVAQERNARRINPED